MYAFETADVDDLTIALDFSDCEVSDVLSTSPADLYQSPTASTSSSKPSIIKKATPSMDGFILQSRPQNKTGTIHNNASSLTRKDVSEQINNESHVHKHDVARHRSSESSASKKCVSSIYYVPLWIQTKSSQLTTWVCNIWNFWLHFAIKKNCKNPFVFLGKSAHSTGIGYTESWLGRLGMTNEERSIVCRHQPHIFQYWTCLWEHSKQKDNYSNYRWSRIK